MGIIDPEIQSRALISKLIVRGLCPGNEPWKSFLRSAITDCAPKGPGDWCPFYCCIFTDSPDGVFSISLHGFYFTHLAFDETILFNGLLVWLRRLRDSP